MSNTAWPRRGAVVVAAVFGVTGLLGLGGCSVIQANRDTALALDRAGFPNASVNTSSINGNETVNADMDISGGEPPSQSDIDRAARVVWTTFRYRIDDLNLGITADSGERFDQTYGRSDLIGKFGPRNPAYDKHTITSAFVSVGRKAAIVAGIGGLLFLVFLVVVLVLVVRAGRRRRAAAPPPLAWGSGYGYGYGPPPPGYGPPPWSPSPAERPDDAPPHPDSH